MDKLMLKRLQLILHNAHTTDAFRLTVHLVNKGRSKDVPLFKWMEKKAATYLTSWPQWGALMQPKEQKSIKRYATSPKVAISTVPGILHKKHEATTAQLLSDINNYLDKSIIRSIIKFEEQGDYQEIASSLRKQFGNKKGRADLLPLVDILNPRKHLANDIIMEVKSRIRKEIQQLETLPYPFRKDDHLKWNLVVIMRAQTQLKINYSDRISRIVAAGEREFKQLFYKEIIQQEVLPCIARCLI